MYTVLEWKILQLTSKVSQIPLSQEPMVGLFWIFTLQLWRLFTYPERRVLIIMRPFSMTITVVAGSNARGLMSWLRTRAWDLFFVYSLWVFDASNCCSKPCRRSAFGLFRPKNANLDNPSNWKFMGHRLQQILAKGQQLFFVCKFWAFTGYFVCMNL